MFGFCDMGEEALSEQQKKQLFLGVHM